MALTKNQKIIIGVVGVAVLGVAVYFLTRKKPSDDELLDISDDEIDDAVKSGESSSSSSCSGNKMGYLSKVDSGKHAVHFASPRPANGTYNKGDKVKITNTSFDGEYTVDRTWIDGSGNIGAIYLPISYTPTGKSDRTFEGKGCITKV
jgi:hypothetical protein